MSPDQIREPPHNFKSVGESASAVVERLAQRQQMLGAGDAVIQNVAAESPLASDLMAAIVSAMSYRNPKLGMLALGAQVAVALRAHDSRTRAEAAPLRPLHYYEPRRQSRYWTPLKLRSSDWDDPA